ncbi:MAG TPA: DUF4388 domain-containing protein, partial [Candidatus Binatus sp.]|nr:DUF4388 domain-containing protein [Candidatus Binatus sp.]
PAANAHPKSVSTPRALIDAPMQGNLSQIGLNDLLLFATSGKKSGVLKLTRGKETVELFLTDGEFVHATCPVGDGEKALLYPVTWDEGAFSLHANGTAPATTIHKPSSVILDEVKAMTSEWETILEIIPSSKVVFRIADLEDDHTDPITVPNVGWRVLSKLDGVRTVQDVADLLRIPFAYTAKVLYNLYQSGLVEPAAQLSQPTVDRIPPALLNRVTTILTEVIGPMAPLVLRDQIEALGEKPDNMPEAKLDDLIALISAEIPDGKLKNKFEESMFQEISNFKRF